MATRARTRDPALPTHSSHRTLPPPRPLSQAGHGDDLDGGASAEKESVRPGSVVSNLEQRLDEIDPQMKEHFLKLQTKHQILATQELPKRQADLNFFDERMREMEVAVTRAPVRSKVRGGSALA